MVGKLRVHAPVLKEIQLLCHQIMDRLQIHESLIGVPLYHRRKSHNPSQKQHPQTAMMTHHHSYAFPAGITLCPLIDDPVIFFD
jgi:hypothetical protein